MFDSPTPRAVLPVGAAAAKYPLPPHKSPARPRGYGTGRRRYDAAPPAPAATGWMDAPVPAAVAVAAAATAAPVAPPAFRILRNPDRDRERDRERERERERQREPRIVEHVRLQPAPASPSLVATADVGTKTRLFNPRPAYNAAPTVTSASPGKPQYVGDKIHSLAPVTPARERVDRFIASLDPDRPDPPVQDDPYDYPYTQPCDPTTVPAIRHGRNFPVPHPIAGGASSRSGWVAMDPPAAQPHYYVASSKPMHQQQQQQQQQQRQHHQRQHHQQQQQQQQQHQQHQHQYQQEKRRHRPHRSSQQHPRGVARRPSAAAAVRDEWEQTSSVEECARGLYRLHT